MINPVKLTSRIPRPTDSIKTSGHAASKTTSELVKQTKTTSGHAASTSFIFRNLINQVPVFNQVPVQKIAKI